MSENIRATGPLYITPLSAPEFEEGGWTPLGMTQIVNTTDEPEVVGFGPAADVVREVVVNIAFTFTEFAEQVSIAFGKLTAFFADMAHAGLVGSHKSAIVRKVKAVDRVNAVREKRENGRGFVKNTTPEAKAMHAAYRRRRR